MTRDAAGTAPAGIGYSTRGRSETTTYGCHNCGCVQELGEQHYTVWENDYSPHSAYRCRRCGHFSLVPDIPAERAPLPTNTDPPQEAHDCMDCAHWHHNRPDLHGVCDQLNMITLPQHGGCIDQYAPKAKPNA